MVEAAFIFCPSVYDESDRDSTGVECCLLGAFYIYTFFMAMDVNRSGPECHLKAHTDVQKSLTEH